MTREELRTLLASPAPDPAPEPATRPCAFCHQPTTTRATKYFRRDEYPGIPAGHHAVCDQCEPWALRGWERRR